MATNHPLWQPSSAQIEASPMTDFLRFCGARAGSPFSDYDSFHQWSITERGAFWDAVWDHCGVVGEKGSTALTDHGHMTEARFFPEAQLNFAENLLKETGSGDALVFRARGQGLLSLELGRTASNRFAASTGDGCDGD